MNNNVLLSIIVNSYNVGEYLNQCLDSILNQMKSNIELIVIDDDSCDNCQKIILEKLNNLPNVSYFFIKHSGISNARNFGIEKAKGKYLMFVDGDDYLNDDSLEKIVNYLNYNEADVTVLNTIKYYEEDNYYEKEIFSMNENENLSESTLIDNKIFARPWRFIYKKEMLINNNISFPSDLVYEDEEWVPKVIYYANSLNHLNEYVYIYRKRKGSITTIKSIDYIMDLASVVERTYNWSLDCDDKKQYIYFSLSRCIRNVLGSLDSFSVPKEKKIILDWYKNNREMILEILNYNKKLKYSICAFGPENGTKVYKRFLREKYSITKEKVLSLK